MSKKILLGFILFVFLLSACQPDSSGAAAAVESYVQALVDENQDALLMNSCADWEESAVMELDAFIGVSATVQGMACEVSGEDGEATLVTCAGNIEATYNNEERQLPLNARAYRVVNEQGNWLVCGYGE
jgi:hypothetical protein